MTPFAEAAVACFEAGANVIPIAPGKKRALVPWKRWQEERQSPDEIRQLRESFPWADVAVVNGLVSGFVDIEADSEAGERALEGFPLPDTERWRAHRGIHRIYKYGRPLRSRKDPRGFEVRASGLSVLPPSRRREWLTSGHLQAAAALSEDVLKILSAHTHRDPFLDTKAFSTCPGSCSNPTPLLDTRYPALSQGGLSRLFGQASGTQTVAAILGIPSEIGRGFRCVLPGHQEKNPSASLSINDGGAVVYHDWHRRSGREFLTLPEVRAALAYGQVRQLRAPELATWGIRLLIEAGVLRAVLVRAPDLAADVPDFMRRVRDGFLLLLGCKWLYARGEPTVFARKFAAAWCGVSERQAGEGIHELVRLGNIREAGEIKIGEHMCTLYLPGGNEWE